MRCPRCQTDLVVKAPKYCSECGYNIHSVEPGSSSDSGVPGQDDLAARQTELKLPSGFSRTLSGELVAKQIEMRTLVKLSALVQNRKFEPGEVLIHKGETKRDLFILTDGVVAISRREGEEELILNEIEPPYILGEVAFLFGAPRTATATAKTEVAAFVLKHEDLTDLLKELPPWVPSLLTSLASGMKSLHHKAQKLEKSLAEAEAPGKRA